jgi:hypothetical protein
MKYGFFRGHGSAFFVGVVLVSFTAAQASAQMTNVSLIAPAMDATVSGSVTIAAASSALVSWLDFYIDGNYLASSPPNTISWNSSTVADGSHTISVDGFSSNGSLVGSASVAVSVNNIVALLAPGNGVTVSGTTPVTISASSTVEWSNFYVDGQYQASTPPSTWNWNTTAFPNGAHTLSANAYSYSNMLLGTVSAQVIVNNAITLITPGNGATVSGTTPVTIGTGNNVEWSNFYIDGQYQASTPPSIWNWDTTAFRNGSHSVSANAYSYSNTFLGSASVSVTVTNNPAVIARGATIAELTGSAVGIPGADTKTADYVKYSAPGGSGGGYPLIGGPLLTDVQAASFVRVTQPSSIELGPNYPPNAAANNYFNNIAAANPTEYLNQLEGNDGFYAAYAGYGWQAEIHRVTGGCPLANPTTAEVLQWAANKWGINPLLLYAEATEESGWDQTAVGDSGRSSGVFQVADRGANHAFPGFSGSGSMLARENTCFNADFYAAHLYSAFHGLTGETPASDIGTAIQSWFSGYVSSPGVYTAQVYNHLSTQDWVVLYFGGIQVPY